MRHVSPEGSDKPFIQLDNSEATRFRKRSRNSADPGSNFQNIIRRPDACCRNQLRQLFSRYKEVLLKLWVRMGGDPAVTIHYTGALIYLSAGPRPARRLVDRSANSGSAMCRT